MKRLNLVMFFVGLVLLNIVLAKPVHAQSIQIKNCQDLQNINKNLTGNYQLSNDIDCADTRNWNNGFGFIPIGAAVGIGTSSPVFYGAIDGASHTISNLYINASTVGIGTSNPVSLGTLTPVAMVSVTSGASIKNLNIKNASILGGAYNNVAILAGEADNYSLFNNIQVQGNVGSGYYAVTGGIISLLNNGSLLQTSSNVSITGSRYSTGGLVGMVQTGSISLSSSRGIINSDATTGGLVGSVNGGSLYISNSYSTIAINYSCNYSPSTYGVGGLVGDGYGSYVHIYNSYAAGPINGYGYNCSSYIKGGLLGNAILSPAIVNSYYDKNVIGATNSAFNPLAAALTTAQMFWQSSYSLWDFSNTWTMDLQNYPQLVWQEQPQISLWNIFSAASQPNIFAPASPLSTVDWGTINMAGLAGVNWADLMVLSKPRVWNYQTATTVSGFVNSVNWNDLGGLSYSGINWVDVAALSQAGIDWASFNPLVKSGINWSDWVVAASSNINWSDLVIQSRTGVNWNYLSIIDKAGVNWQDWAAMSKSGINWVDLSQLSNQRVNWSSIGSLADPINLNNLAKLSKDPVNWSMLNTLSKQNVDWNSVATLNKIPISSTDFNTLRTILANYGNIAPSFTRQPVNQTVNLGNTATFSVYVSGATPLQYQWQKSVDGGSTWVNLTLGSSKSYSYVTPPTKAADNGSKFRCVVSNVGGTMISNTAVLKLNVQVGLFVNHTGNTVTIIASLPSGINCPSSACSASFPMGQSVVLSAYTSGKLSNIYDWGIQGCLPNTSTCSIYSMNGNTVANIQVQKPAPAPIKAPITVSSQQES